MWCDEWFFTEKPHPLFARATFHEALIIFNLMEYGDRSHYLQIICTNQSLIRELFDMLWFTVFPQFPIIYKTVKLNPSSSQQYSNGSIIHQWWCCLTVFQFFIFYIPSSYAERQRGATHFETIICHAVITMSDRFIWTILLAWSWTILLHSQIELE